MSARFFPPFEARKRCWSRRPGLSAAPRRCRRDRSGYPIRAMHRRSVRPIARRTSKNICSRSLETCRRCAARAFLKAGPAAIEVLENHSEVKLRAYVRHPDYRSELEGAALAGRALEPYPFDGRLLGEAFKLVRPPLPEFTLLGGMMVDRTDIGHLLSSTKSVRSLWHSTKLVARYARDKASHGRGTRLVMGNALVGRLLYSLMRQDVDILTGASLAKIIREPDGPVRLRGWYRREYRARSASTPR